jgi:hypothetical protein
LIQIKFFTDVHQCPRQAVSVTSVLKDVETKIREDMMDTAKYHEKPGIDYLMILIPVIYWIILILEALMRK